MGHVVQIDVSTQFPGQPEFLRRHVVSGKHDLPALKAAGMHQHQLVQAGAIHAAAFVPEDAQNGRGRQGLVGEILLKFRHPGKGGLQAAGGAADGRFII